ncbi:MAG: chromate resistance protein ChrB [Acidocella sp.]|nr:chromate resistance protein ChrB [Acidocella sp.]
MNAWLLLTYKVPPEPSRRRVALWRRLKAMGAVYLQNGVCLLPKTEAHIGELRLMEAEIAEMAGESVLLETMAFDAAQENKVMARFKADRDDEYREVLGRCAGFEAEIAKEIRIEKFTYAELDEETVDFKKLKAWYEKIKSLDYYGADLAKTVAARLNECEALLDDYARRVFEAQVENQDGAL